MSQPDETTPHVLIVDDDTRIRELLQKYLSDNGYRTSTAADAAEEFVRMSSYMPNIFAIADRPPAAIPLSGPVNLQEPKGARSSASK